MEQKTRRRRRRCVICRKWFVPHYAATKTQKTCSKECRCTHRRTMARYRREQALDEYREDERLRQRKSRARRKKSGEDAGGSAPEVGVSRASQIHELLEIISVLSSLTDTSSSLSRTILREAKEKIFKIFETFEARDCPKLGQEKPSDDRCHAPP